MQLPRNRSTLLQLTSILILLCAVALALVGTPGSRCVLAIAIVLPGFFIEQARGGTGVIGGVVSTAVLAVGSGIAYAICTGGAIAALPAIYFIFVISLIWGAIASMTLYWVIKTCRGRRLLLTAVGPSRVQYTLGQLMGLIAVCAVVFAALATPVAILVAALGIVVPGFVVDRLRGGAGIVGGMISASASVVGIGIAAYAYSYFKPDPTMLDYLGPPILTLPILGVAGGGWGALAGSIIDVAIVVANSYRAENPMIEEPSGEIVWLLDEVRHS